jgi:hypothetical protein
MELFEVLYGRRCRTLLNWIDPRDKVIFGPDIIEEAEATRSSYPRQLKSCEAMPRDLCKQEVSTLEV